MQRTTVHECRCRMSVFERLNRIRDIENITFSGTDEGHMLNVYIYLPPPKAVCLECATKLLVRDY